MQPVATTPVQQQPASFSVGGLKWSTVKDSETASEVLGKAEIIEFLLRGWMMVCVLMVDLQYNLR